MTQNEEKWAWNERDEIIGLECALMSAIVARPQSDTTRARSQRRIFTDMSDSFDVPPRRFMTLLWECLRVERDQYKLRRGNRDSRRFRHYKPCAGLWEINSTMINPLRNAASQMGNDGIILICIARFASQIYQHSNRNSTNFLKGSSNLRKIMKWVFTCSRMVPSCRFPRCKRECSSQCSQESPSCLPR